MTQVEIIKEMEKFSRQFIAELLLPQEEYDKFKASSVRFPKNLRHLLRSMTKDLDDGGDTLSGFESFSDNEEVDIHKKIEAKRKQKALTNH